MNQELIKYIEKNIFPVYQLNDEGHNIKHILYVIRRSLEFAKDLKEMNLDMVYTIAAYHDIGHHIDAKNHEKISAMILHQDLNLRRFFTEEEIEIMKYAIEDHRASSKSEPRNIYGKIVSSADRNTSLEEVIKRTYYYRIKHAKTINLEEIIEDSRKHIIEKFGQNGYAREKMYFEDQEYLLFLKKVENLAMQKEEFTRVYKKICHLK